MLRALQEQWRLHPPVNYLVAAYLQHKPAEPDDETEADTVASDPRPDWLAGMGRSLPAPAGLADAATAEDALASLERMFFGEVNHELRR